jgi:hypothetical protein
VCTVCGKGICEKCYSKIEDKLYCKSCADKVLSSMLVQPKHAERVKAITFASILYGLSEVLVTISSILIFQAMVSPKTISFVQVTPRLIIAAIANVILGPIGILIAYLLWKTRRDFRCSCCNYKHSGHLAFSTYPFIDVSLSILALILLAIGWKSLT